MGVEVRPKNVLLIDRHMIEQRALFGLTFSFEFATQSFIDGSIRKNLELDLILLILR